MMIVARICRAITGCLPGQVMTRRAALLASTPGRCRRSTTHDEPAHAGLAVPVDADAQVRSLRRYRITFPTLVNLGPLPLARIASSPFTVTPRSAAASRVDKNSCDEAG